MVLDDLRLSEEGHLLSASIEPLLEDEIRAEAGVREVNAPPELHGKWRSLNYRRVVALKLTFFFSLLLTPLVASLPVQRDLMYEVVCSSVGVAQSECAQSNEVNEIMARLYAWQTVLTSVLQLITIPLVTGISERLGYRAGMIWTSVWLATDVLAIYALAYTVPPRWTYWRMLIPSVVEAVAGGVVTISNAMALALMQLFPETDLRPRYLSYSKGLLGASGTFAPSIGSYIARKYGMDRMMLTCGACVAGAFLFALIMGDLPEFAYTKEPPQAVSENKPSGWAKAVTYVREQVAGLSVLQFRSVADRATRLAAITLLYSRLSADELTLGDSAALSMYTKQHLGWDSKEFGLMMMIVIGSLTFWGIIGFPLLQRQLLRFYEVNPLGIDGIDYCLWLWSSAVRVIGSAGVVTSESTTQMLASVFVKSQSALSGPIFMTSLMKLIPTSEGASLITAMSVLDTVCAVFIPGLMLQLYKVTLSWWPRFVFELETVIFGLQLVLIVVFVRGVSRQREGTA